MSGDPYPDRDEWPGYWRGIRTAGVWLAVIIVIVGGGSLLPRPDEHLPRIAVDVAIGLTAAAVATFLASRAESWWRARHP